MRDNQKTRVYKAEHLVGDVLNTVARTDARTFDFYGSTLVLPDERKFGDIVGVQRYVDQVLALNWVRDTWPTLAAQPVKVRTRRGAAKAEYRPGVISVPDHQQSISWAMRELVVLHELAHHLARGGEAHGAQFVSTYLHLVNELVGHEVGLLLTDAYSRNGVAFGALVAA
uniref:TIGR04338 family metallohydrolase n=1 Tax=Streptomyces sp. NBC_01393 TaxID=2903851 RepID=A0AAU3I9D6_9ACTN